MIHTGFDVRLGFPATRQIRRIIHSQQILPGLLRSCQSYGACRGRQGGLPAALVSACGGTTLTPAGAHEHATDATNGRCGQVVTDCRPTLSVEVSVLVSVAPVCRCSAGCIDPHSARSGTSVALGEHPFADLESVLSCRVCSATVHRSPRLRRRRSSLQGGSDASQVQLLSSGEMLRTSRPGVAVAGASHRVA